MRATKASVQNVIPWGLDPRDFQRWSHDEWVARVGEAALRQLGATKAEKKKTADEVLKCVRETDIEFLPAENTFRAYLSRAANDLESAITSAGRGRAGGYFVSEFAHRPDRADGIVEEGEVATGEARARVEREAQLYPVLKSWLIERGYRADDTSARRKLGRWGNPDVVGIRIDEHLGAVELEVASIEAKPSVENWEKWIFEAVSHRRFVHRAYFAFAVPDELRGKMSEDLRYYSERFGVGILTVVLANDVYRELLDGSPREPVTAEDADVVELYPATPDAVPMRYRKQLCKALDITGLDALFHWGDDDS